LIAGLLPPLAQQDHGIVKDQVAVVLDGDGLFDRTGAQNGAGHISLRQSFFHLGQVAPLALDHQSQFLAEKRFQYGGQSVQSQVEAAIAAKGHLQHCGDQAAVAAVMTGQNQALVD